MHTGTLELQRFGRPASTTGEPVGSLKKRRLSLKNRLRRPSLVVLVAAAFCAVIIQFGPAPTAAPGPVRCGTTTLEGTIQITNGRLVCGPGQPLVVRDEIQLPRSGRNGTPLLSFVAMTDFQLPDEESPLRGEFADKCGDQPFDRAFRFNDTLLPALLNSQVRAANDIAIGPVTGRPFDFAVQLGDASDNQQYNEVRAFIDLLDGGTIVDPDSGEDGYDGNQGRDPYTSPVSGTSLRDLANEPFWATGLKRTDGSPLPWFTVMGNHDAKVRGTMPNNDAWKAVARQFVTGNLMINDLAPDQQQRVCDDPAVLIDPLFWAEVAASPGTARLIPADPDRRLLDRNEWIGEHTTTRGAPITHGPSPQARCKDASGTPLARACYSVDMPPAFPGSPPVHLIMLDTSADEGLDEGNIDQAQWNWLNADLKENSSEYFTNDAATDRTTTGKRASLIVVMSHHTVSTLINDTPRADAQTSYDGKALERLLLRFPNVVMQASGHTHANRVVAHQRPGGGGYFEVNTSSIADFPHQSRTIEIVDNHDGTMSIFAVNFDAAAPVDPSAMRWEDDATPETLPKFGGAARNVNEEQLASIARFVGAKDPQSGAAALAATGELAGNADKNVELVLKHPTGGAPRPTLRAVPRPRIPPFVFRPRFPFGGFPFPFPPRPGFVPQPPKNFITGPTLPGPVQQFGTPTKALGAPADGPARQYREMAMLALAVIGALWVRSARIRGSQIGL